MQVTKVIRTGHYYSPQSIFAPTHQMAVLLRQCKHIDNDDPSSTSDATKLIEDNEHIWAAEAELSLYEIPSMCFVENSCQTVLSVHLFLTAGS